MTRNLTRGNVGEAHFRYWYETKCHGLHDITLRQFGYNPEGIVVGEEKVKMLKQLERSTDFAVYRVTDLDESPQEAKPVLGISINTQNSPYNMFQSRASKMDYHNGIWGCYNCPRSKDCFDNNLENLWFNEYNISNDYNLFFDEFRVDVVMVTILSKIPDLVLKKIEKGHFEKELREYILGGNPAIEENRDIVGLLDYILFDQRFKKRSCSRTYEIVWLKYSDIHEKKIPYHITGGVVSRGRPRPVACIDKKFSRSEAELIKFIEGLSKYTSIELQKSWYVHNGDE